MSAKVTISLDDGEFIHRSGGDTASCPEEQAYFAGSVAPSANAGLTSLRGCAGAPPRCPAWPAGAGPGAAGVCCASETPLLAASEKITVATRDFTFRTFPSLLLRRQMSVGLQGDHCEHSSEPT